MMIKITMHQMITPHTLSTCLNSRKEGEINIYTKSSLHTHTYFLLWNFLLLKWNFRIFKIGFYCILLYSCILLLTWPTYILCFQCFFFTGASWVLLCFPESFVLHGTGCGLVEAFKMLLHILQLGFTKTLGWG